MEFALYRGMFIPENEVAAVINNITENGMNGNEGRWDMEFTMLHEKREDLLEKVDLTTADTRDSKSDSCMICACGDEQGAAYYALEHNYNPEFKGKSLIVSISSQIESLVIDGRDFLYTAFQMSKFSSDIIDKQKEELINLFGVEVLKYYLRAIKSENQNYRIALCDLACQDPEVIRHHYQNKKIIAGRFKTRFCSAFLIKAPIMPKDIKDIKIINEYQFSQFALSIDSFLGRV